MGKAPLSDTILEALFHLGRPSASSHLAALSPEFAESKKTGLPPSVQKAILAFSASENNLFLNPKLMTTESALPESEGLLETAIASFVAAMTSTSQAGGMAQPPVSTVAHDREMLRFGRTYGSVAAPDCSRGSDCSVNRVRMAPPERCLQVYLTPAEHEACLEDNANVDKIGPGLCLLCIRSCVAASCEYYNNTVSNIDQLPRQCGVPLPCCNLIDVAGGYRSETFGACTPLGVSPAITAHSLVGPSFDLLRCVYEAHTESWRVDQSAIEWGVGSRHPNGGRTRAASTSL